MRVHNNPVNPYAQLDAMYAAQRAAAKREAANTRRKLMESASKLAGDADSGEDCVVRLGQREEPEEQPKRQRQPKQGKAETEPQADSSDGNTSVSDWA